MFELFKKKESKCHDYDYLFYGNTRPIANGPAISRPVNIEPVAEPIKTEPIISESIQTNNQTFTHSHIDNISNKLSSIQMSIELKNKIRLLKGDLSYEEYLKSKLGL